MKRVQLYTRDGCCLCDDAKVALARVHARIPFELEVIDIAADPELTALYGEEIPVICVEGKKVAKFRLDEAMLERRLK